MKLILTYGNSGYNSAPEIMVAIIALFGVPTRTQFGDMKIPAGHTRKISNMGSNCQGINFHELEQNLCSRTLKSPACLDLLNHMFEYSPQSRPTASAALQFPFFN